jgi:hypothetical protein
LQSFGQTLIQIENDQPVKALLAQDDPKIGSSTLDKGERLEAKENHE